ncbi:hypothetical protein GCM10009039_00210 [Halocalculus aciditolerans]|uniref:Uncharacterized protein n=1 Tax=Halocalculus aciditolerans TaxID=1383812 RepID=A0A830F748_9EURY|nr:hypothetical protein GCM10009039_00210 [Halocalculus aciditolerans]
MWARHSNPKSGWSRALAWPVLVAALYCRKPWLGVATVGFLLLNPVLFPAPAEGEDAWMRRVVEAEEAWLASGETGLFGWPNVLNLVNLGCFVVALYGAWKRRPVATAVGTVGVMAAKFAFVAALVRRYAAS